MSSESNTSPTQTVSISGLLIVTGNLITLASIAGFAGGLWWPLELAAHFRVQYFLTLGVFALVLCLAKRTRVTLVFAAFAIINLSVIARLYVDRTQPIEDGSPALRAMLLNVHTSNEQYHLVNTLIEEADPDFIIVEEINDQWLERLESLRTTYPYIVSEPRDDNFGMALFSRHKFIASEIAYISAAKVPTVLVQVEIKGRPLTILGTHPLPPYGGLYARLCNDQLAAIPEFLSETNTPILLLGDLNTSPWSPFFGQLLRKAHLSDSSVGFGVQPTWPTHLWPLLIPLDHCLYSDGVSIDSRTVGADIGSDHYPIIVDFRYR
jgi:endonuclease/exonuclease/phosphatase (EEP) superfamily protein YafD